jgi:cell division transport system permease protein
MITILSRIVRYGLDNFWRNGILSTATVVIMALALFVFHALILFGYITNQAVFSVQEKIDISVYFKSTASEDQILSVKESIESLSEVKSVEYVSRDAALTEFKDTHKDDPTLSQAINELSANPLLASLNIKAKDSSKYADIAAKLSASSAISDLVESITYSKNQGVIERLNAIIRTINRVGFFLTLILASIACLMVLSTIWLAIFSNREEIAIMRVVGASNAFVRGPYLIQGVIAGVLGSIISIIVAAPLVYYLSPSIEKFVSGLQLFNYFLSSFFILFFYQLVFGVFLGVFASYIAIRRYLKI